MAGDYCGDMEVQNGLLPKRLAQQLQAQLEVSDSSRKPHGRLGPARCLPDCTILVKMSGEITFCKADRWDFFADLEGGGGGGRRDDGNPLFQGVQKIPPDQGADFLGAQIISVTSRTAAQDRIGWPRIMRRLTSAPQFAPGGFCGTGQCRVGSFHSRAFIADAVEAGEALNWLRRR